MTSNSISGLTDNTGQTGLLPVWTPFAFVPHDGFIRSPGVSLLQSGINEMQDQFLICSKLREKETEQRSCADGGLLLEESHKTWALVTGKT